MKKHFTCQELILVLLASAVCLGTAASAVRNSGNPEVLTCADNMRKMVQAAVQYAADNQETLPGSSNQLGVNWQMRIAPYLGYRNLAPGWRPEAFPVFRCPTDKNAPAKWLTQNAHIAKISYCANAVLIDLDGGDVNVDRHKGGRKLTDVKRKDAVILFAEDHNPSNALRYGAAVKCFNKGYTYEYSRQNGTLENDDAKVGYHDYRNNYAMLDGSVLLCSWEETLKPENRWILK